jgi:putative ABC transport system permease protein
VLGVTGYVVAQRTGEMAVRAAIGATRRQLLWLVFGHGARMVTIGMIAGVALTWWTGKLITAYVYNVSAADPMVIGFAASTVLIAACAATWLPARRAAAVDPSLALRSS